MAQAVALPQRGGGGVIPELVTMGVLGLAAVACVGTVAGFFGRLGWLFDTASHFRLQYVWILAVSAVLLLIANRMPEAAIAAGCALMNVGLVAPFYVGPARRATGQAFRALLANVQYTNRSYERIRRVIRDARPDFVVLQEVNQERLDGLQGLQSDYPFSRSLEFQKGLAIVLLSRVPVQRVETVRIAVAGVPSFVARLQLREEPLTLVVIHTTSPTTPAHAASRNRQLSELAKFIAVQERPVMLLGDLNTTSWSSAFRDLVRGTRLVDSRVGFGLQPTWPAHLPFMRIPIDHCLVSPEVVVRERRIGPRIGSDHFPVIVDFSVERAHVEPQGGRDGV